ncbi:hypothetical protein BJY04DRAFT_184461 [Aspergillus karnatakaensis]|uniref:uncharacterized protein n=1 Tax=Aspergillus karnatakaensis TaxID=1810916 RepID=UPI003CCCD869
MILPSALNPTGCRPHLKCNFCERTFRDEHTLSHHKSKAHHVCEHGCVNKAFSDKRNRARHYANAHSQSKFKLQCGCGHKVPGERRDNYLRHLESGRKPPSGSYSCGRDSHETHDKATHLAHVQMCKGQAGRKKKNQTRSRTCQE